MKEERQDTWIKNAIQCFIENNKPVRLNEMHMIRSTTLTWTAGFSDTVIVIGNYLHAIKYIKVNKMFSFTKKAECLSMDMIRLASIITLIILKKFDQLINSKT